MKHRIRRLGISGGTLDPIHHWHLLTAWRAAHQFALDKVLMVPNGTPVDKEGVTDAEIRFRLAQAGCWAYRPILEASRIEIDRPGKSYTVQTLEQLRDEYGPDTELFFITGMDRVGDLQWFSQAEEIFRLATIVIASRDESLANYETARALLPASARFELLRCASSNISSSEIRRMVRAGEDVRIMMPDAVYYGLKYYGLYRPPECTLPVGAEALRREGRWALKFFEDRSRRIHT